MSDPKQITKETELAAFTFPHFSDWDIYPEVPCQGGSIDMYMFKDNLVCSVECKLKLNFGVMDQAHRNTAYAHMSYICVPNPKIMPRLVIRICRDYGIGVLTVNRDGILVEKLRPRINRKIKKLPVKEFMKQSVAGALTDRMTAHRFAIEDITKCLMRSGGKMNIQNLFSRENGTYHWKSVSVARKSILDYIQRGKLDEFRMHGQYLMLTDTFQELNAPGKDLI